MIWKIVETHTKAKPENSKPSDAAVTENASDNGWFLVNTQGYSLTVVTLTLG